MGVRARCQIKEIMAETEIANLIDGFGHCMVLRFYSSIFYESMSYLPSDLPKMKTILLAFRLSISFLSLSI